MISVKLISSARVLMTFLGELLHSSGIRFTLTRHFYLTEKEKGWGGEKTVIAVVASEVFLVWIIGF